MFYIHYPVMISGYYVIKYLFLFFDVNGSTVEHIIIFKWEKNFWCQFNTETKFLHGELLLKNKYTIHNCIFFTILTPTTRGELLELLMPDWIPAFINLVTFSKGSIYIFKVNIFSYFPGKPVPIY